MFFTVLINLPYLLYKLEALWLSLLLHTLTHSESLLPCGCATWQATMTCRWRRGGKMNRGRLEEGKWELHPFVSIFFPHICSAGRLQSFHICQTEENHRQVQNMFICFLFLACLPSLHTALSFCHESCSQHTHTFTIYAYSHTFTHRHTQRLVAMHITWVLHLWRPLCFFHFATYSRDDEVEAGSCT